MTKRLRGAILLACTVLAFTGTARASEVTSAQLRALAARAVAGDAGALTELSTVSAVDGQPAPIGALLQARSAGDLTARLRTLAATAAPAASPSAETARQQAAAILAARRFGDEPVANPSAGALDSLGRALSRLASDAPGGPVAFWGVVGAFVLVLTGWGVRRTMRRLEPLAAASATRAGIPADTPESLEKRAAEAERQGAFADAVRLRFRAGLLQLGSRKLIDYNPAVLTSDVAHRLHSPQFDALATSFERIAYGGATAGADDATAAREGWRALARERGR
jgi:hypothetical protein